jgi:hypothetical protein
MILFPRKSLCTVFHSNDVYGLHASNCRTTARHERLKHLLKSIAVEANLSAITDQQMSLSTLSNMNVISQSTSISLAPEDHTMTPLNSFKRQWTAKTLST